MSQRKQQSTAKSLTNNLGLYAITYLVVMAISAKSLGLTGSSLLGLVAFPLLLATRDLFMDAFNLRHNSYQAIVKAELERAILAQTKGDGVVSYGEAKSILLTASNKVRGDALEQLVGDCYAAQGFTVIGQTELAELGLLPPSGDQGADRILINAKGDAFMIQIKNYKGAVNNKAVQECIAAMAFYGRSFRFTGGMVVTNSTFTSSAKTLADRAGIALMDGEGLGELLVSTQSARHGAA